MLKKTLSVLVMVLAMSAGTASAAWQCSAYDGTGRFWDRRAHTRLDAIYRVRETCENNSNRPGRCVVPASKCFKRYNATSNTFCKVRDRRGRHWVVRGNHPCKKAMKRCRHWHRNRGIQGYTCWIAKSR